jgi:hypothetical protein
MIFINNIIISIDIINFIIIIINIITINNNSELILLII